MNRKHQTEETYEKILLIILFSFQEKNMVEAVDVLGLLLDKPYRSRYMPYYIEI